MLTQPLALATAQNTTSGTEIDFTGIPSWAKRITVMLNGVSTTGTSLVLVRLGDSGGIEATGYASSSANVFGANSCNIATSGAGFVLDGSAAGHIRSGHVVITNVSGNTWVASHSIGITENGGGQFGGGSKTLSDSLDRIRITTVNGADTFDAGSVNIMYEG
jgi:hypothetical protein